MVCLSLPDDATANRLIAAIELAGCKCTAHMTAGDLNGVDYRFILE
jgi:hypothetical protein